ncbi:hypothetical protein OBV_26960 [Oscillibacter valericigenes Sjm18-20]|nr:hypothetical protein OBV_26960 [Oscillibacter valericigenes Sjm18-20]
MLYIIFLNSNFIIQSFQFLESIAIHYPSDTLYFFLDRVTYSVYIVIYNVKCYI